MICEDEKHNVMQKILAGKPVKIVAICISRTDNIFEEYMLDSGTVYFWDRWGIQWVKSSSLSAKNFNELVTAGSYNSHLTNLKLHRIIK